MMRRRSAILTPIPLVWVSSLAGMVGGVLGEATSGGRRRSEEWDIVEERNNVQILEN